MWEESEHATVDWCLVYYGGQEARDAFGAELSAVRRGAIRWRPAEELFGGHTVRDEPSVLIADEALLERLAALESAPDGMVIIATDVRAARALGERVDLDASDASDAVSKAYLLDAACRLAVSQWETAGTERAFTRVEDDFDELRGIGIALMHEHDRQALLDLIIAHGKRLTESDGGGVLLIGEDEHGVSELRPVVFRLDSLPDVSAPTVRFPVDNTSMVGHAALTKKPVVVADAEALPPGTTFMANKGFERRYGYAARSMLAVPMLTQRDDVLGVVFFINRKSDPDVSILAKEDADRYIVPFTDRQAHVARTLASIAAVSIENARLYTRIEDIFESFVKAAVSAVDARDPTTAGHSLRVAALTTSLAAAVERTGQGPYSDVHFTPAEMRELRFAALLHDIGKVAVREDVLVKAKKLPPLMWERIDARFDLIRRTLELEHCRHCAESACTTGADESTATADESKLEAQLRDLDRLRDCIRAANEPSVVASVANANLEEIARRTFQRDDGHDEPYLTADELCFLQIPLGSLDEHERAEIESHVEKTHQFLEQIPWTDDLKRLVTYAAGHHEKLNGTGYPNGLTAKDIPIQTRMITLANMFVALTSSDRPYKCAVTPDKALEIIRAEADKGLVDRSLVDIMSESQVYKQALEKDWRQL